MHFVRLTTELTSSLWNEHIVLGDGDVAMPLLASTSREHYSGTSQRVIQDH